MSKRCNCSDWDDETPCQIHNPKLPRPDEVCHHTYVLNVYRRKANKKWFYTVAKDSVRIHESVDFNTKPDLTKIVGL